MDLKNRTNTKTITLHKNELVYHSWMNAYLSPNMPRIACFAFWQGQ